MRSSSEGRYDIATYDQQRDDNSYDKNPYKLIETNIKYSTKHKNKIQNRSIRRIIFNLPFEA
jgi:hypothetical protein